MEIQISPTNDQDSGKQKDIRKKSQKDPLPLIIVRTLICIAVIDSIIWGYFAFVKKVTLIEGLKGWTTSVQKVVGYDTTRVQKFTKKTAIVNKNKHLKKDNVARSTINQKAISTSPKYLNTDDAINDIEVKNKVIGRGSNIMYSWRDENGTINYSNTGFPEGKIVPDPVLWTQVLIMPPVDFPTSGGGFRWVTCRRFFRHAIPDCRG